VRDLTTNREEELCSLSLECAIKKVVVNFYENVDFNLAPQQAMRPGGLMLTREVLKTAGVERGWRILDVACGIGTTMITLVSEHGCHALGLDLSDKLLEKAKTRLDRDVKRRYMTDLIRGDSELMPIRPGSLDAVICECSLSLFPDKRKALKEMVDAVRHGGKVIITDVTIKHESAKEAGGMAAWCMCIAGAETMEGYLKLMKESGLEVVYAKDVSEVYDWESADPVIRESLQGKIGYAVLIGRKP